MPDQFVTLFVLALPIAMIAWTVTHEEIFREFRDACATRSRDAGSLAVRKLFYLFTCEYCFSFWVTVVVLLVTGYRLLYDDWRGSVVALCSLVWIANHYMSIYGRLRIGIRSERATAALKEELRERSSEPDTTGADAR